MSRARIFVLGCCLVALPFLLAAKPAKSTSRQFKDAELVELFAAIQAGDLDVKFIPKNTEQANVIVENRTNKPLRIQMPAAFAGVPVLAQGGGGGGFDDGFGGGGGGGFGNEQGNQQGQQALGGGMGGGMMGGGMMGGGMGGMFNVAPGRVHKFKVGTVCLEHGKKDPNPRVPYELRPIEAFTSDVNVHELCTMLGTCNSKFDQVAAQAAAWHLTDNLSLEELSQKVKVKHLNGTREMYFSPKHLQRAARILQVAKARAAKKASQHESPGESLSDGEEKESL